MLRSRYGNDYMFEVEEPVYLRVTARQSAKPDTKELESIFKAFWLNDDGGRRSDTSFVYLNAYNNDGKWVVQLYWDPKQGRIVSERTREHH